MTTKKQLILCSQSPRRKELLSHLNIKFVIRVPDVDENSVTGIPLKVAQELSVMKAKKICSELSDESAVCVGADTIVVLKDKIFGKPANDTEAREILLALSGKWHEVITGVSIVGLKKSLTFAVRSDVRFEKIDDDLLDDYLATKESLDKAGAYGIQGSSLPFIKEIRGSYSNIVGLPIAELRENLKDFLGAADDTKGKWRELFF